MCFANFTSVLVAADVREALDLPRHHRRETVARLAVSDATHRARSAATVGRHAKSPTGTGDAAVPIFAPNVNKPIEPLEELDVPRLGLGDREL